MLPFLIVHGAMVWKGLLVALIALTYAVSFAIRQHGARRVAREALARQTISSPRRGQIAVRGRVASGTATTRSQLETYADSRTGELALDCDGARVEIVGDVRVEQGAATHAAWNAKLERSVTVGDEVIAIGTMIEGPAEAVSYRDGAPTWRLEGDVKLLATTPRARVLPLTTGQHVAALLAIATLWFGVLYAVGNRALARGDDQRRSRLDGLLPELGSTEIAAAMPGSRDRALEQVINDVAVFDHARSERGLHVVAAIRELQGECAAATLARAGQLDAALAAARSCRSALVPDLLAFEGRFDEAEKALAADRSETAVEIHIAAGNWAAAAAGADERAKRLDALQPTDAAGGAYTREAAIQARCVAALFRTFAGDKGAFAKLDRGHTPACAIAEAAALPIEAQLQALATIPEPPGDGRLEAAGFVRTEERLLISAGGQAAQPEPVGVMALLFPYDQQLIWFAPSELAAHPNDDMTETARESMVAYDAVSGNLIGAREQLAHVANVQTHATMATALALRDGSAITPDVHELEQPEAVALRNGKIDNQIQRYLDDHHGAEFREDLRRAYAGDGRALAAALRTEYLQWDAFAQPMLGLLPHVKDHREEATSALRVFRDELGTYSSDRIPFHVISDDALYRDAAKLLGDTEDAKQWQTIIDRYVEMLRDRQRLIAFELWHA